ncbi:MAG: divalent-cation tolerance protein CutA [Archaeoglobaceae archaeon]|nr:divalent-cation tolerance protein CutA [Archaeoglobaceae archaeon]
MYTFVYITTPSKEEAEKIAKAVLEKRIAACVNIFPIKSFFLWENKLEIAEEYAMIVKTRAEKFSELRDFVKSIHSYSVPCICSISIEKGLRDFLEWIDKTIE